MNSVEFQSILDAQIQRVQDVLGSKAGEYASDTDRLANFKTAANLLGVGIPQALGGMMVKHTVSVYDMIMSGKQYPLEVWDEKITDHLNYLILLRATLIDNARTQE